ncbi:DNA-binding transcriptional regulator, MarR family [Prauserella aidingensis]|uniref:MarR family winged helix-turn-helix transcriptional regulator n=1 Tax=Prauserella aidingensis TaxID=387890 RepID=UPI0020A2D295|nr:MarR family transcriptional regulator [Prauserella aidingensis]MCP2252551.1 DNA-binding transcriptional regulator, MarR family [Prauserella aidingensis]
MADDRCTPTRPAPALICLAFETVTAGIMRGLHEAGFDDLRPTHFLQVLRHLTGHGDRPADLARLAGVTPQAIGQTLAELEDMGYVRREPDPADQRSRRVFWAERGLRAGAALEEHYASTERRWAAAVGDDRLDSTRTLLAAIIGEEGSTS